ncbi:MAG: IPT/TIG domain-containing protein [Planctomycetes bacterium]|nr:IPT/TIG domain-containing protein [Planctomycetota bacterium]
MFMCRTARHWLIRLSFCAAVVATGLWALLNAEQAHAQRPTAQAAGQVPKAGKTFRLNDGTELPIDEWPETYEAVEWQPPLDPTIAKTLVEYDFRSDLHVVEIGLDREQQKVYWFACTGGGNNGKLCRANYDGSHAETLLDHYPGSDNKELLYPRALCVAPELDAVYWVGTSYSPTPGQSIFRADLNGKNARPIVTGLKACVSLYSDSIEKKIYWHDENAILRGDLNGDNVESITGLTKTRGSFGIDIQHKRVFRRDGEGSLSQAGYDGGMRSVFLDCGTEMSSKYPADITYVAEQDAVYCQMARGVVCVRLKSPGYAQQITRGQSTCFAIDAGHRKLFWSDSMRHGGRLISGALPDKWPTQLRRAPPLISSIEPHTSRVGQEVTVRGKGLRSTRTVFMIGNPRCELVESQFKVLSDEQLLVTVPKFTGECRNILAIVVTDTGATVTVPQNLTRIDKVVQFVRYERRDSLGYWISERGLLDKAENAVGFIEKGGVLHSGTRGGNVLFAKNGAHVTVTTTPVSVFHEPYAEIVGLNNQTRCIAIPAIRASFIASSAELGGE